MNRLDLDELPIGFNGHPPGASPFVPLWISIAIIVAVIATIGGMEASRAFSRILAPSLLSDAKLFPKDGARCCDANGNQVRPR